MGKSGFIFTKFEEPDTKWVNDLAHENLKYSHTFYRNCPGDWRWQMEMHIDLLHVSYIHPTLNSYIDIPSIKTEAGPNYIAQYHNHGWWLFVYPGYHIEYEPGKLFFSELIPNNNGIGYQIFGHYLFSPTISQTEKNNFCKVNEITLDEDIVAVANIKTEYVKPRETKNPLEIYNMHWFEYYKKNHARKK
jgi:phenylpropionate dioxygenase-like ring-hydroxylating dioxygenase large terminal subunit